MAKSKSDSLSKNSEKATKMQVAKKMPAKKNPLKLRVHQSKTTSGRQNSCSSSDRKILTTKKAATQTVKRLRCDKKGVNIKTQSRLVKKKLKEEKKLQSASKSVKTKAKVLKSSEETKKGKDAKQKQAKKVDVSQEFIDLWALATYGKREASLNASMKVNIMYESFSPVKKDSSKKDAPKKQLSGHKKSPKSSPESVKKSPKSNKEEKAPSSTKGKKEDSPQAKTSVKKKDGMESPDKKKNKADEEANKKRRNPGYKIFKDDEPKQKSRKAEKSVPKSKPKKKTLKKAVAGHQLSNIIEKSPRQASLNAKAMIAMEQEEELVHEASARTRIFDWTELRSPLQTDHRRMVWRNGLGFQEDTNVCELMSHAQKGEASEADPKNHLVPVERTTEKEDSILHSEFLKTLHHIGDTRLLKEYLRAQKEDFHGEVDVEKWEAPEKVEKPVVVAKSVKMVAPLPIVDEKNLKPVEKQASCSPAKPQPCRVATPIPQFPAGQRTTHMTSFVHQPVPQQVFPTLPHVHPQPIKVTPYTPNPTYIYQYSMDRQESVFLPTSQSPLPYAGVGNNDMTHRDFPSSFTFNHMGSLSLGRRGVNPYQSSPGYNHSMHLPMQQMAGMNFPASYYPSAIQQLPVAQQDLQPLQQMALHQAYPSVVQPQLVPPEVGQMAGYAHSYPAYPQLGNINADANCMPPPPPPSAHVHRSSTMPSPTSNIQPSSYRSPLISSVSPMDSLRSMNPPQVQPIAKSPVLDFSMSQRQTAIPYRQPDVSSQRGPHFNKKDSCNGLQSRPATGHLGNPPIIVKKERDGSKDRQSNEAHVCKSPVMNHEAQPIVVPSVIRTSENSEVSDVLRSVHSTMFPSESSQSVEPPRSIPSTVTTSASSQSQSIHKGDSPKPTTSAAGFSASYSVLSILDMPSHKVKPEPELQTCAMASSAPCSSVQFSNERMPADNIKCPNTENSELKNHFSEPSACVERKNHEDGKQNLPLDLSGGKDKRKPTLSIKQKQVIVIEDTDESSTDDEPLANLIKQIKNSNEVKECIDTKKPVKRKVPAAEKSVKKIKICPVESKEKSVAKKVETKIVKEQKNVKNKAIKISISKGKVVKPQKAGVEKSNHGSKSVTVKMPKEKGKVKSAKKLPLAGNAKAKKTGGSAKVAEPVIPLAPVRTVAVHGWRWVGEGEMRPIPKLSQQKDETLRFRKCFKSMIHAQGEVVSVGDCVILQSDGDSNIPYVAKISALWENESHEMMFSMLWYYQPEHTARGRENEDGEQELFASKHREENSVACIDDICFVLMYNEYCRLETEAVRQEQGVPLPVWRKQFAIPTEDSKYRRRQPPANMCADNIWFSRYDYDFRKKIVKKPKHKKSNLRYRVPYVPKN